MVVIEKDLDATVVQFSGEMVVVVDVCDGGGGGGGCVMVVVDVVWCMC